MNIYTYMEAMILASELNGAKPVIISIMLWGEQFKLAIEQLAKPSLESNREILDNPGEPGLFVEYMGFKFRIYKPQ